MDNCVECGQDMTEVVIKQGSYWHKKKAKLVCSCGFEISKESDTEKNNRLNEEFEHKLNKEAI